MTIQQKATQRVDSVLAFLENPSILDLLADIILYTDTRKIDLDTLMEEAHELVAEQIMWDGL
jgi:hypothetical protein